MPNKPRRVIFTPEEVRAYMAGRKTQFRRVINPQPSRTAELWDTGVMSGQPVWRDSTVCPCVEYRCPFGSPGDPLYVAETWSQKVWSDAEFAKMGMDDRPRLDTRILWCGETLKVVYRADGECKHFSSWKPSTTMPRHASRLGPVVTEVRVQQVQDITDEDVVAEGIDIGKAPYPIDQPMLRDFDVDFETAFRDLYDSRNPKPAHAWAANPWVWAVTVTPYEKGNDNG